MQAMQEVMALCQGLLTGDAGLERAGAPLGGTEAKRATLRKLACRKRTPSSGT